MTPALTLGFVLFGMTGSPTQAANVPAIDPDWNRPTTVVNTGIAMEVCVEPPMRPGKSTHDGLFGTLADLHADYSRLSFWFPYPRLAVAELETPTDASSSWDFRLMDPVVVDFMKAAGGRPVVMNFATIPQWMFRSRERVPYPKDPDAIVWGYETGSELRDPTLRELREYFVRLFSWYMQGGFTDEQGLRHQSDHHFRFDVWEVLNEVDFEHRMSPELYTRIYDEMVVALRALDPRLKFAGPALARPGRGPEFLAYFLDPTNHKPGIPIDFLSYHFYAHPETDETPEIQQHTFFALIDGFVSDVRYIETLRKRLSPATRSYIDELGTTSIDNVSPTERISPSYWSLSAATFAYGFLELARLQIDLVGAAELIDYPGQFPGASLTDWNTGRPNPRYQALKLLHDQISRGDRMVGEVELRSTGSGEPSTIRPTIYAAQGFISPGGGRKVLVINKRMRPLRVRIPGAAGGHIDYVDIGTGAHPPAGRGLQSEVVDLGGFAVAVIHLAPRRSSTESPRTGP